MCSNSKKSKKSSYKETENNDKFTHGNLVSLYLKNFMTFDEIKLSAGPNLNFVLGPNGTGKSAVVCGLILGLAGDPSHTGRTGSLAEYVQFGKNESTIIIELFNQDGQNFIVERKIILNKKNPNKIEVKTDWSLNDKKSNTQNVKNFIASLNVFTDNLCQFLPQEKVVEFCKLNKQQLLLSTEKAAGNIQMYEDHQVLIKLSSDEKQNDSEIEILKKKLEHFENLNQHYETQVKLINERVETEKKLKLLSMKKPWLDYEQTRQDYNQAKARMVEIEKKLAENKKKLPFEKMIGEKKEKLKSLMESLKDLKNSIIMKHGPIKEKLDSFSRDSKENFEDYNMKMKKINEQQIQIENLAKEIRILKSQLDSIEDEDTLKSKSKVLDEEYSDHVKKNLQIMDEINGTKRSINKILDQATQKRNLLKQESNVFNVRMNILRENNDKLYRITIWLESNKHLFRGKIFPPIMLYLNAKKTEYIDIIENLIPKKDLLAFMFTDENDIAKFNELVFKEFNYRVSILITPKESSEHYLQRRNENILKYFDMFASDLFSCPEEITTYLYSQIHLHLIPISFKNVNFQEIEENRVNIKKFYASGKIYTMQRSEYDGEMIVEIRRINKGKLLKGIQNEEKIAEYKNDLLKLESENKVFYDKLGNLELEFDKENQCKKKDEEELNIISNKIRERNSLQYKIDKISNKLKMLEDIKIDLDKEKESLKNFQKNIINSEVKFIDSIVSQIKNNKQDLTNLKKKFECKHLYFQIKFLQDLSKKYEETFKQLEEELATLKQEVIQKQQRAKALFIEAHKATGTDEKKSLPASIKKIFDKLPDDISSINTEIRKLEWKLDSNNTTDTDNTQSKYNENKKSLLSVRESLDNLNTQQARIIEKKKNLQERWLTPLVDLINKISEKFELFMKKLNFDGLVKLDKGTNENDFEKYGISVMVKYRQEEELSELNFSRHSGGEKSVATMIYVIALQKLTAVPFRVVDEINQGMDDTNERNVLKLIMELSNDDSSQYFILSPKLVPSMEFNDKVDFLFIFNGPYMYGNF